MPLLFHFLSSECRIHRLYLRMDTFILSKRFFFHFFSSFFFVISVCLGVINHGMLLANRRSSSNRASPSSIFFGLRRTQRCPRHVYPIIVMSSVSRFIRPRREWSGLRCPSRTRPIRASTTRAVIVHSGKLHFLRVVATRLRILCRRCVYNVKVPKIRSWSGTAAGFYRASLLQLLLK